MKMDFEEWTIQYVKHRDIFHKKLLAYKKEKDFVVFKFKDKTHHYLIQKTIDESVFDKFKDKEHKTLVCGYKKENMDFVVKHWKKLVELQNFLIIFVDPDLGRKLLLNPQAHNSIADPESLETGLKSMFNAGIEV